MTAGIKVADLNTHHADTTNEAVFTTNLISTLIESIAIIYLILPLIPALHIQMQNRHKPRQKNSEMHQLKETDKQNGRIAFAAVIFGGLRWTIFKTFNCETNIAVGFVLYLQRNWQGNNNIWHEYALVFGAQILATVLCVLYAICFIKKT